jgi:hypothetical protein
LKRLVAILILLVVAGTAYGFWRYLTAPISVGALLDEPPALAPRIENTTTVVPPQAQVEEIKQRVRERTRGFSPNGSQVARFAREVCGAFGQGYSYEQVSPP